MILRTIEDIEERSADEVIGYAFYLLRDDVGPEGSNAQNVSNERLAETGSGSVAVLLSRGLVLELLGVGACSGT